MTGPTARTPSDVLPDTPTRRALQRFTDGPAPEAATSPRRREIEIDPDAPDAPICSKKYIVVDPDAPDAPICKPRRYIEAPDPEQLGAAGHDVPAWARALGTTLAGRTG